MRNTFEAKASRWALTLGVSVLLCASCGDSTQEQALVEASQQLSSAREHVEALREEVGNRRQEVEAAKKKLASAERELSEAQKDLREAESRIDLAATDAALFRAVQKRLLDDRDLRDVAIDADVQHGIATLRGNVPNPEIRERALEVAESVPGIAGVENRIAIVNKASVAAGAKK